MKKWPEEIKTKKKTIVYGEQVLNNGKRSQWKTTVKKRWIHYGKFNNYVTYLCGKTIYHENANFSSNSDHITCPRCIELLKGRKRLDL